MNIDYNSIVSKLERWISSWKTKEGRYLGPVVHRRDLKRLKLIHDTPWSQAEIINGYVNLFNKTSNTVFLDEAILAATAQAMNQLSTGEFIFAGHEDDRFSSLIHNALADCALLNVSKILFEKQIHLEKYEYLLSVVKKNIDSYFIGILYNVNQKVFNFNRVDFYSINENRCVCNMNSIAAEAMIKLSVLIKSNEYDLYIINICEWLKKYVNTEDGLNRGAISYSHTQPNDYISIYTALCLRGMCEIYNYLKDEELKKLIEYSSHNLISFMDGNMFMHEFCEGRTYSRPWFISGSGMIFNAIRLANHIIATKIDEEQYLKPFLKYQLSNGAFENFVGYDSYGNRFNKKGNGIKVWEDVFPTIGWNAQLFSYLSNFVDTSFVKQKKFHNVTRLGLSFLYVETQMHAFVLSLLPLRSNACLFYNKKRDKAILAFNLLDISRKVRRHK